MIIGGSKQREDKGLWNYTQQQMVFWMEKEGCQNW